MRKLYSNEALVLPIGSVNLKTGENKYIDDYMTYNYTFVLIRKNGKYSLISGASDNYYKVGERITLAHDQTHRNMGTYTVIGEFNSLKKIQEKIHKTTIRGYVFK